MRAKVAEKLSREQLIPRLAGDFVARGTLVYHRDLEWLLRGFNYERSGHPGGRDVYVWVFVQPLYSPSPHVVLDVGHRLGGGHWTLEEDWRLPPGLVDLAATDGVRFLERMERPVDLAGYLEDRLREAPGNTRLREDAAYSRVLAGDHEGAADHLAKIEATYRHTVPYDWEQELLERASRMRAALREGGDAPLQLLRSYREFTVSSLGLST